MDRGPAAQFRVDEVSTEAELAQAAHVLTCGNTSGYGSVVFDDRVVLRPTCTGIRCEVIDRTPAARRCAFEKDVLVENAQRALAASTLSGLLSGISLEWRVVEVDPSDTG